MGLDGKIQYDSVTTAILRHCAAHRKIVEIHAEDEVEGRYQQGAVFVRTCKTCGRYNEHDYCYEGFWPCGTLRALAEAYDLTTEPAP